VWQCECGHRTMTPYLPVSREYIRCGSTHIKSDLLILDLTLFTSLIKKHLLHYSLEFFANKPMSSNLSNIIRPKIDESYLICAPDIFPCVESYHDRNDSERQEPHNSVLVTV
jgi:hypothetical protein